MKFRVELQIPRGVQRHPRVKLISKDNELLPGFRDKSVEAALVQLSQTVSIVGSKKIIAVRDARGNLLSAVTSKLQSGSGRPDLADWLSVAEVEFG